MIRVGILGANPERSWAARAHVPALRALDGYTLTVVGTTRRDSAERAAREFGAEHACTDPRELAAHPEVDLVVVTVRVPAHAELVGAALDAGKHVLCEWPLARDTAEATALADAARTAGVHAATGLQTRFAPAVAYARDLLAAGYLGTVTSATVLAARGKGGDGTVPAWGRYTFDVTAGAGTLEVMGGHALDTVEWLLGPFTDVSAATAIRRPDLTVAETGEPVRVTSPDHVALHGVAGDGVLVSGQLRDAESAPPRTRLEIAGTAGNLAIVTRGDGPWENVQLSIGDLDLLTTVGADGGWRALDIPAHHRADPSITVTGARNVSRLYRALREDLRTGTRTVTGFDDAVHLHRLLDAVRRSAADRTHQRPAAAAPVA